MSQSTISIRVDSSLKKQFDSLCEIFGLSTTAAFNIFMKAVVREKKIPFEIKADSEEVRRERALAAWTTMRKKIADSDIPEMSLDEINAEIQATRNESNLRSY